MKRVLFGVVLLVLGLVVPSGVAGELMDNVSIHGFGGWGYGETDGYRCSIGNEDGNYDNASFNLNLTASPIENLKINAQVEWKDGVNGSETGLDYAFAEWTFSDALKIRVGKVKSPVGIYSEIYDVGTLRPFFTLPVSSYGTASMATKAYLGLGLKGALFSDKNWSVDYDLYGGKFEVFSYNFWSVAFDMTTMSMVPVMSTFEPEYEDVIGGRFILNTPLAGLSFGLSAFTGDAYMKKDGIRVDPGVALMYGKHYSYTLHGEYWSDSISIRSEYKKMAKNSGEDIETESVFLEASYLFLEHWQIATLYDQLDIDLLGRNSAPPLKSLMEHEEFAFGLNYWFSPNFVLKASYHWIDGNFVASPEDQILNAIMTGNIDEKTEMFVLGAQFSF